MEEKKEYHVVGINFETGNKIYYFDINTLVGLRANSKVVVESDGGEEVGTIREEEQILGEDTLTLPLKKVVRVATQEDISTFERNKEAAVEALKIFSEKVKAYSLPMEPLNAHYNLNRNKITFFFSSQERIDFRELVKELITSFRGRVELRQVFQKKNKETKYKTFYSYLNQLIKGNIEITK